MAAAVIGETYIHYRTGGHYRVLAIGLHTETAEEMVVYQSVEDGKIWIRPRPMFEGMVEAGLPAVAGEGAVERFRHIP